MSNKRAIQIMSIIELYEKFQFNRFKDFSLDTQDYTYTEVKLLIKAIMSHVPLPPVLVRSNFNGNVFIWDVVKGKKVLDMLFSFIASETDKENGFFSNIEQSDKFWNYTFTIEHIETKEFSDEEIIKLQQLLA